MEKQVELNEERNRLRGKFSQLLPDFMVSEQDAVNKAYKDGVLSAKTKRLMAMAIALGVGCTNCVLSQTTSALEEGATNEEIFEAFSVVVALRGTTGIGECLRVVKFLEETGRL